MTWLLKDNYIFHTKTASLALPSSLNLIWIEPPCPYVYLSLCDVYMLMKVQKSLVMLVPSH